MLLLRPTVAAAAAAMGISINVASFAGTQIDSVPYETVPHTFQTSILLSADAQETLPIVEVIKVFGRLAGPECYGKRAPPGSSCQITEQDVDRIFVENSSADSSASIPQTLTVQQFENLIRAAPFQWPLKPFGVNKDTSLVKTASMNKGAETKVYMDLLEERQLYNPRDPAGPLPTSLRPKLNRILQDEGIDPATVRRLFQALSGDRSTAGATINVHSLKKRFEAHPMDYYEFLDLMGKVSISWP
jgi:hypothetical protein